MTKLRVLPNGDIEIELNGSGISPDLKDYIAELQSNARIMKPLERAEHPGRRATDGAPDWDALSPKLRAALETLAEHENGCHYTALAKLLGITGGSANSRCQELKKKGFARRMGTGVYQVIL